MTQNTASVEHGHPNYVAIWGILVGALLVSLLMGFIQLPVVTVVLIFSIAAVKAYLVLNYFMHLKAEPFFVVVIVVAGLACLYFLFFGLVPDIVFSPDKLRAEH
ncbi:MAG: cytochrome C oxidase subunit IV family protein [Deltaproteobacteria bacterium]|nr:cytochrome C oxidase subunit IV family protein [Deltaproteobacteria bacterium]